MTKKELVKKATEIKIKLWEKSGNLNKNQQWKKEAIYKSLWGHTKAMLIGYVEANEDVLN
jgi:hypothetical protein